MATTTVGVDVVTSPDYLHGHRGKGQCIPQLHPRPTIALLRPAVPDAHVDLQTPRQGLGARWEGHRSRRPGSDPNPSPGGFRLREGQPARWG